MPVDVESELARLGTAWSESIAHVGVAEVLERTMATSSRSSDDMVEPPATQRLRPRVDSRSHRSGQRWLVAAACTALVVSGVVALAQRPANDPEQLASSPATTPPTTLLVTASGDGGTQTGTLTAPPATAAPARDALGSRDGPGRYFVDPDGDDATPLRVTFEVATDNLPSRFGWVKYLPGQADGFTGLSITTVTNLVTDGCEDHRALDPPVGPTVDDLAIALSELAPFEVTAPPTDVTLFGYQGKHLELTVPALAVTSGGRKNLAKFTDCFLGEIHSWISPTNDWSPGLLGHSPGSSLGAFNAYQMPGQTEEFWILDVEGTRVVLVSFDTPNAPAADIAERDAIFDTIRIEP